MIDAETGLQPPGSRALPTGSAAGGGAAAAAAGGAAAESHEQRQHRLLAAAVGKWLSLYGGKLVPGYINRPTVVNLGFELLLGGASGAPGRPLTSLVLLLRGLWEYLHCHGLARLLAKPLKAMHALRNTLLVSAVPLWMRRAAAAQLDSWERSLLWQHAASPLEVTGAVGLVHLLRALQEARQVCLHHWDEPQLAALLSEPVAEQRRLQQQEQQQAAHPTSAAVRLGSGGSYNLAGAGSSGAAEGTVRRTSSSEGGAAAGAPPRRWQLELPSLLALRLLMLAAVGQSAAYLELAMAGRAWKKAIDCMLHSKERGQLLRAVQLLPRHIASLSERMGYMHRLLLLESLGAPERLELVARLLLDVHDALTGQAVKLHGPPSRASRADRYRPGGASGASGCPWHLWEATLYSLRHEAGWLHDAHHDFEEQRMQACNSQLWTQWSELMRLFIMTAAQALLRWAGHLSAPTSSTCWTSPTLRRLAALMRQQQQEHSSRTTQQAPAMQPQPAARCIVSSMVLRCHLTWSVPCFKTGRVAATPGA
ncbi:hypothetical protein COO60DRAFT_580144 [Scenedesmus sp. NREL 46B-D3]|nr:hypothetical protein COO60DRAFT_580144 [Scenedesmus sp. NREL 46B-D3]